MPRLTMPAIVVLEQSSQFQAIRVNFSQFVASFVSFNLKDKCEKFLTQGGQKQHPTSVGLLKKQFYLELQTCQIMTSEFVLARMSCGLGKGMRRSRHQ